MIKVATGMVLSGWIIHNRDIPPDYVRVSVEEVVQGYEDYKFDYQMLEARIKTLHDALGTLIMRKR